MVFSTELLIVLIVAAVISGIGWFKFLYFISVGYGFSVAGCGVALLVLFTPELSLDTVLLCSLLIVYGCRLSGFLLFREIRSASYKKALPGLTKTSRPITVPFKFIIWVSFFILYVLQMSPVFYRLYNISVAGGIQGDSMVKIDSLWAYIGACVMAIAILLESLADFQKSRAKKENPARFCDRGLYKIVRCPNYFGEVLFWTGCFLSGIGALQNVWQWVIAAVGYVSIVYIMFGGARRLEIRQNKNYGSDPEYQNYVSKTPILLPLVPVYHLEHLTFLKG